VWLAWAPARRGSQAFAPLPLKSIIIEKRKEMNPTLIIKIEIPFLKTFVLLS
jgi:hypothetical protein